MRKISILFLFILFLFNFSCNKKGNELIHIPGSKVSFPKSSFDLENDLIGLKKDHNTVILITEMPNEDIQESIKGFEKSDESENSSSKRREVLIDNYKGVHWITEETNNTKIHLLIFGNSNFSVVVTARHKSDDKESEDEILFLLENLNYDEDLIVNPLDRAPFYIAESSEFKNFRNSQNTHFYGKEGKSTKPEETIFIFHGKISGQIEFENSYNSIWTNKINDYEIESYNIELDRIKINGHSAFESIFEFIDDGILKKEYLLFFHNGENYIGLSGIATNDFDNEIASFRKFANQIKFKNNSR